MVTKSEDELDPWTSRTPNSTPKKETRDQKYTLSASQPLPKTSYLSPNEKISKRLRTYSQTSDASLSDNSASQVKSKKSVPKRITQDGVYNLDPRTKRCKLQYMEEYVAIDQAERLHDNLVKLLSERHMENVKNSKSKSTKGSSEINLTIDDVPHGDQLGELLAHQTRKMESSLRNIFNVNTTISNVLIRRLPNYCDSLPYESFSGHNGANPVVAALSLGAPRVMKIKKNSRITHVVSLHPGTLCVLSGKSTLDYTHSIPKSQAEAQYEQMVLFFVGSPSNSLDSSNSDNSSVASALSASEMNTDGEEGTSVGESSESEVESLNGQIVYPSLFGDCKLPNVLVTQPEGNSPEEVKIESLYEELMKAEQVNTDVSCPDRPAPPLGLSSHEDPADVKDPVTPELGEQTIIQSHASCSPIQQTIRTCLYFLPEQVLNDELCRNGCSTEGNTSDKRERLAELLEQKSPMNDQEGVHSMIEKTQLDIKEQLRSLTREITELKTDPEKTKIEDTARVLEENKKVMKAVRDAWDKNLSATNKIMNRIEECFQSIGVAEIKGEEIQKNIRILKTDLKNYYNSAFFREDSELIKQMHATLTSQSTVPTRQSAPTSTSPPPLIPIETLNPARRRGNSTPAQPSGNINPSHRCEPPTQNTAVELSTDSSLRSRRPAGFNMTQGMARVNSPMIRENNPIAPAQSRANCNLPERHGSSPPTLPVGGSREGHSQSRDHGDQPRTFKTFLITDSILRHVSNMDTINALGTNHRLHLTNRRDTSALNDVHLRQHIRNIRPDYIYLHLGVNDVHQNFTTTQTLTNFFSFFLFMGEEIPECKVFVSLPLYTGDPDANNRICKIRRLLSDYVSKADNRAIKLRTIFMNPNNNFMREGHLVPDLYASDGVHLTERGKRVILANMRHSIHEMTRIVLGKPRRERTRRESQSQRESPTGRY